MYDIYYSRGAVVFLEPALPQFNGCMIQLPNCLKWVQSRDCVIRNAQKWYMVDSRRGQDLHARKEKS